LSLHPTETGDALEVDVLLSELKEGKTPKTALIIKLKNQVSLEQILKDFLDFDVGTSVVSYARPSVTLKESPKEEISYIVPLMKFVSRSEPATKLFNAVDDYLDWKAKPLGESGKNIKFITVVGTSGKGKTTFARRFIDLPYAGKYPEIIKDCKDSNRRYRVDCGDFLKSRDAETQLSLLVLFEAFKHSAPERKQSSMMLTDFFLKSPSSRISFHQTLQLITDTFGLDSTDRLVIINIDETNLLLANQEGANYLKQIIEILRSASKDNYLISILSGTHSVALFDFFDISGAKHVDIDLPLIELNSAKEIILGMSSNPNSYSVNEHLEYLLRLCGGIGRYLEIAIIEMSIMGGAVKGFKQDCYENFLDNFQTSQQIEILLGKVTMSVLTHYPNVFSNFGSSIELLSCYTIFEWVVDRMTMINDISVGELEKKGMVFLQPVKDAPGSYLCIIPFITLFWALKYSNHPIQIPLVGKLDSYSSPDESENNSLRIVMAKLSGLMKKNGLIPDEAGCCKVMLSELFPLRYRQPDVEIKFHNSFLIMNAGQQINMTNYQKFKSDSKCVAYLNAKGAPFTDAVIFCEPMIGIQEKQSVLSKRQNLKSLTVPSLNSKSFKEERNKFPADAIFVLITDGDQGDVTLGEKDIFIDYNNFNGFAGPLVALRKLYCINELNPTMKRLKEEKVTPKKEEKVTPKRKSKKTKGNSRK
jgi:GTPase SAR1 family protein